MFGCKIWSDILDKGVVIISSKCNKLVYLMSQRKMSVAELRIGDYEFIGDSLFKGSV